MAILLNTLTINGFNLGTHGLQWKTRDGWNDGPEAELITHKLPIGEGVFFQEAVENKPRIIKVEGTIHASTISGFNTNLDEIKNVLNGSLQVKFSDDSVRYVTGYRTLFTVSDFVPGAIIPIKPYKLTIVCPDPRKYSTTSEDIAEDTDCPLGTARVRPTVTITGPATNPTTITLKDYLGVAVSSFTMTGILSSGNTWIINSDLRKVEKNTGSGPQDDLANFAGTFPNLDPEDADFANSLFPEFDATAGAPASLSITYSKAWR